MPIVERVQQFAYLWDGTEPGCVLLHSDDPILSVIVSQIVVRMRNPGPAYEGMLIYTADGYVAANIMPESRSWGVDSATLSDLRQTVSEGSFTGYAGRYEVNEAAGTVTHIPSVSPDPADEGRRLVRHYILEGDTLKLSGKWMYEGRELVFTVIWTRVN